jgi:hypothetical protein
MLGGVSEERFAEIIRGSMGRSPVPAIEDSRIRDRALAYARRHDLEGWLDERLSDEESVPPLTFHDYRDVRITGNRGDCDRIMIRRLGQVSLAAMRVHLTDAKADYLENLLWAECEATWWELPTHERPSGPIDLHAAQCAARYGLVLRLLRNRLHHEVVDRVDREIRRRVLDTYLDPTKLYWWHSHANNWNAVCNGGVGMAAMLLERDADRLTAILLRVLHGLPAFLNGFTPDGGCSEGPSYWMFGFGWYVRFAAGLYDFTDGRVNILADERVEPIARYLPAVTVAPGQCLPFADAEQKYLPTFLAYQVNRFLDVPELFGFCRLHEDGSPAVESLEDLLVVDERTFEPAECRSDAFLPELGVAMIRRNGLSVAAKAGHNQEHHNHLDVGSLIVHRGRTFFLTDPGAPVYKAGTFGPRRYEGAYCNSFGHGVPAVGGRGQSPGGEFSGTISADGLGSDGPKRIVVEMAGAYDQPALRKLTRQVELPSGAGEVLLTDTFEFDGEVPAVEEAFVTALPAEAVDGGRAVRIPSEADGVSILSAEGTDGRFDVVELTAECAAESRDGSLLRRIVFVPAQTARRQVLRFRIGLG